MEVWIFSGFAQGNRVEYNNIEGVFRQVISS